jgi:hypothetical protein
MATAAAMGGRSNGEGLPAGSPSLFAAENADNAKAMERFLVPANASMQGQTHNIDDRSRFLGRRSRC